MSIQACLSLICCVLFYCKRPEIHFSPSDKDKIQRSYSGSDPQPSRRFFPLHGRRHRDLRCQPLPIRHHKAAFRCPSDRGGAPPLLTGEPEILESGAAAVSHAGNILIRQSFPVLPRLPEAELQRVQENVLSLYINSRIELDSITLFISQPASVGIMHIAVELEFPCLRICHEIRKDIPCRRIFSALRPEYIPSSGEMGLQPAASYASPSDFFDQYQYNSSSAGMQTKPFLDQMHISFVKIVYFLFFFHNSCGILLSVISQIRV